MLFDTIQKGIPTALKAGDRVRVETLRYLLSHIKYSLIDKYQTEWESKVRDEDVLDVVKKQVKTHRESIEAFTKANRIDLVEKEKAQLLILEAMLPSQLSDEELRTLLTPIVSGGEKNFGLLMKKAMEKVMGKADGSRVSGMIKQLLSIPPHGTHTL